MTDITSLKLKRDCNKVCIQLGPTGCPSRTSKELDFHLTVDENCCEGPKYCVLAPEKGNFPLSCSKVRFLRMNRKMLTQSQSQSVYVKVKVKVKYCTLPDTFVACFNPVGRLIQLAELPNVTNSRET